jgi:hypothetical protein
VVNQRRVPPAKVKAPSVVQSVPVQWNATGRNETLFDLNKMFNMTGMWTFCTCSLVRFCA